MFVHELDLFFLLRSQLEVEEQSEDIAGHVRSTNSGLSCGHVDVSGLGPLDLIPFGQKPYIFTILR